MENEMMNEVITTETVEDITTQVAAPSKGNGFKTFALVGGIMTLGALAWEFGVKPIGRKVGTAFKKAKDKRNAKSTELESDDDEIMKDLEEEFPTFE